MSFIVADVRVLKFRILNKSKKVFLHEGDVVTVSIIEDSKNGTLKVWKNSGIYLDYKKYYDLGNPVTVIKK